MMVKTKVTVTKNLSSKTIQSLLMKSEGGAEGSRDQTETRTAESLENKLKQMAQSNGR